MNGHIDVSQWLKFEQEDKRIFVSPEEAASAGKGWIGSPSIDLLSTPWENVGVMAQGLFGEKIKILESTKDWLRIQLARNHYVGWVKSRNICKGDYSPTHRLGVPRTFLYHEPDIKAPRSACLSLGSSLVLTGEAETRGTKFFLLESGEGIIADHVKPIDQHEDDYVTVAESLLRTPYLWGGDTAFGIDCSGLVGLSMGMAGRKVLRDSDMQAATIGEPVDIGEDWLELQRGDLVFWRGHVAIAQGLVEGAPRLIHANGHTMDVTSEPVVEAVERIAHLYAKPIGVRRP